MAIKAGITIKNTNKVAMINDHGDIVKNEISAIIEHIGLEQAVKIFSTIRSWETIHHLTFTEMMSKHIKVSTNGSSTFFLLEHVKPSSDIRYIWELDPVTGDITEILNN